MHSREVSDWEQHNGSQRAAAAMLAGVFNPNQPVEKNTAVADDNSAQAVRTLDLRPLSRATCDTTSHAPPALPLPHPPHPTRPSHPHRHPGLPTITPHPALGPGPDLSLYIYIYIYILYI